MTSSRIVPLDRLSDSQVLEVAKLHHAVMHSLLSEMGMPFLERYYQIARREKDVLGFCAISENGSLLGWVSGSPKPDQLNGRLRDPLTWFIPQILRLFFTRRLVLWQLISSVLSSASQPAIKKGAIELTYIGVAKDQVGVGLGTRLINRFLEASREAEYDSVELSVEVDNLPAIALYEKTGFETTQTFSEGRYQRHRMEIKI